ncbi:MAG: DUF502 domain-containing protein [bacterium]|nr:DUF502 domain-containing protein [bacterium]
MRKNLITGIIALLPIGLTIFVFWFLIDKFGGIFSNFFKLIPGVCTLYPFVHSFMGFLAFLIIVWVIGAIATSYIGHRFFVLWESIIIKVPFIRPIYAAGRQLSDALSIDKSKSAFKSVVIVEFPRKGVYSMGFLTNDKSLKIKDVPDNISVFVPTVPNITTGFYLIIPRSEVIEIPITIDAALRTIVSGGIIPPEWQTANVS